MKLIDQHTKKIMEECKLRARDAGLRFDNESLEYIVTNNDMLELSPKAMIPTMYDYWVNDVDVLRKKGEYELYPSNPYETVINSRPAISFYNDNNPDWLNIMIFYHVLAHIDFFQNNVLFKHTWTDDFVGQSLADKRLIANLRLEHGRWVDYIIEFSRSIDNLCGYFGLLARQEYPRNLNPENKIDYYFNTFLPEVKGQANHFIYKEIERYNEIYNKNSDLALSIFFAEVKTKYPEFEALWEKSNLKPKENKQDVLEYIRDNSQFLAKEKNLWMKSVINIIRNTSLYFSPQIRTKTINEGWASYWHDKLFRMDNRITGHESDYAKVNAWVTSVSRVGLNPYAIGLRLLWHIEELADKGKLSIDFQNITDAEQRNIYDTDQNKGLDALFKLRNNYSDFMLFNTFVSQDFTDKYNLFVVGKRLNQSRGTIEYFVKSRKASEYKNMLISSLYHPPYIEVDTEKTTDDNLYLIHRFEGKQLVQEFIPDTMVGIEYLWGGQVQLETTLLSKASGSSKKTANQIAQTRFVFTMKDKKLTKKVIK